MDNKLNKETIHGAAQGDSQALEGVINEVRDLIFNLSLRMLGTIHDAEDATQDITVKIITHLSTFKNESSFSTWVFRIATNHLINYKKHMFSKTPFSFEFYGDDIENGKIHELPDLSQNVEKGMLSEELKLSCTNVMLQCLDTESRLIFILGTMFKLDSSVAGEILGISADTYRKRLSRIRKKVGNFLLDYCGEYGGGSCRCEKRLNYAIQSHRLNPSSLDYTLLTELSGEKRLSFKSAMEELDDLSAQFAFCKIYESPEKTKKFMDELLSSKPLSTVKNS